MKTASTKTQHGSPHCQLSLRQSKPGESRGRKARGPLKGSQLPALSKTALFREETGRLAFWKVLCYPASSGYR